MVIPIYIFNTLLYFSPLVFLAISIRKAASKQYLVAVACLIVAILMANSIVPRIQMYIDDIPYFIRIKSMRAYPHMLNNRDLNSTYHNHFDKIMICRIAISSVVVILSYRISRTLRKLKE